MSLRWTKLAPGVYVATSPAGAYRIDGNNPGRNRWCVTYPDADYASADSLGEAKAWADIDADQRAAR